MPVLSQPNRSPSTVTFAYALGADRSRKSGIRVELLFQTSPSQARPFSPISMLSLALISLSGMNK